MAAGLAVLGACTSSSGTTGTSTSGASVTSVLTSSTLSATTIPSTTATTLPASTSPTTSPSTTAPLDATNVYGYAGANMMSPNVAGARPLVYVPSAIQGGKGYVDVIDQATMTVVDRYKAARSPSTSCRRGTCKTLYVTAVGGQPARARSTRRPGSRARRSRSTRPYNLYFTPDGTTAVVMAEQQQPHRLLRPATWTLPSSVPSAVQRATTTPTGRPTARYFIVTCEFSGDLLKVDTATGEVARPCIDLGARRRCPRTCGSTPDGKQVLRGRHDARRRVDRGRRHDAPSIGHIATGVGAHGIYPSRDGQVHVRLQPRPAHGRRAPALAPGEGSVSVVDPATDQVVATWTIPGGGSPDMGGVSADGTRLWLSGRYDAEVYVLRHGHRRARGADSRPSEPARSGGVAPARPLLPRSHGQHRADSSGGKGNLPPPRLSGGAQLAEEADTLTRRPSLSTVAMSVPVTAGVPSGATSAQP